MSEQPTIFRIPPEGDQPPVEFLGDRPVPVETCAGRVHVEWAPEAPVTPLGQLPFFIEYLKLAGLFDNWVSTCPLHDASPNAPSRVDFLGTVLLPGHSRYAHITTVRADTVNPPLLGMKRVLSEDAVRQPRLLRGDRDWGNGGIMRGAEQRGLAYLFRLRMTTNVKRALTRAMAMDAWDRQRRMVLLRRKISSALAIAEPGAEGQQRLSFATVDARKQLWEYGALVTSLDSGILTRGQLYRDRGDCENNFDETKNQWGWGGFITQDMKRRGLMARCVALIFNWWNLFARLADPDHHREAITSRPLLLSAIDRQTRHGGQTTIHVSSPHAKHPWARQALTRISAFFSGLWASVEQLTPLDRWYRILSQAMVKYLKGRQLVPPRRIQAAGATAMG